ncbi:MAG: glucose 1-dehydrogenase [Halobacteriales archaeon]
MKAVAVRRGERRPELVEMPRPEAAEGEALVQVRRVGIDGTDHEVIAGGHGGFPPGEDRLVLGHEAVGVVEDPNGTGLSEGRHVVPTVRRPPDGTNEYFERGEPDMAPAGAYVERGIAGAHGFMAEYVTSPAEFLVPVPESLADVGFLIEPLSNAEKALDHAAASREAFTWDPGSALVLGNGPLGLLTLARLEHERRYCLGRRDRPDPTIEVIEGLGATYVDSRETAVEAFADAHEPADLVVEATGDPRHPFAAIEALAPGGVAAILGVPGDATLELEAGALHRELVLENKALVGSVNSSVPHFEAAIDSLAAMPEWFTRDLITGVYPPEDAAAAFETGPDRIKTVVEF